MNLKSKDFENAILYRFNDCEDPAGRATISRYGVTANPIYAGNGYGQSFDYPSISNQLGVPIDKIRTIQQYFTPSIREQDKIIWQPIQSLPDFEGVFSGGRQFIIEAKVCSQASLSLDDLKVTERQIQHLIRRSRFGVITALAIHWNPRELKTKSDEAETWLFPVHHALGFWVDPPKRINREKDVEHAVKVEWNIAPGKRKLSPDILPALKVLAARYDLYEPQQRDIFK